MRTGHIYVADYEGTYVIRLVGDVRLTLCISFDQFIESTFVEGKAKAIIFDLRKALGIDSTTLGLMAKISIRARARGLPHPKASFDSWCPWALTTSLTLPTSKST